MQARAADLAKLGPQLPTATRYKVERDAQSKETRIVKADQPNWYQATNQLRQSLCETEVGKDFLAATKATQPLSLAVGRRVVLPAISVAYSAESIAREFLVSYLFLAGNTRRWRPSVFEKAWSDLLLYFDPSQPSLPAQMYAPIQYMPRVVRSSLKLGGGLWIRRLSPERVAHLASASQSFAWAMESCSPCRPSCFLVWTCEIPKQHIPGNADPKWGAASPQAGWTRRLNEEVAILRVLLSPALAVPGYAIVYEGAPLTADGAPVELPWRRHEFGFTEITPGEVDRYVRLRRTFFGLKSKANRAWERMMGSMRRFAVAWENPFQADALADVVAALEGLLVGQDAGEYTYKTAVRAARFLGRSREQSRRIFEDVRDAYRLRCRVFHGGIVFDDFQELVPRPAAKNVDDLNAVIRLTGAVFKYYRDAVARLVTQRSLDIDWKSRGL